MALRIVSGSLKGSVLKVPKGTGVRPPLARMRKSICDMLASRFPGARVLDLYAGSGSFGIEAVSRGAASATMVERGSEAAAAIAANVERLNIRDRVIILHRDADRALRELGACGASFDIIFVDPPFAGFSREVAEGAGKLLAEGGVMLLRTAKKIRPPEGPGSLTATGIRIYGISRVHIYEKGGMK